MVSGVPHRPDENGGGGGPSFPQQPAPVGTP
ncbi:hypothetical protein CFC21_051149, partial [Triticum aestivum]